MYYHYTMDPYTNDSRRERMGKAVLTDGRERYDKGMRSRVFLFALFLIAGALTLPLVAQAGIPFFGPIIPAAYNVCAPSWGQLIEVINNIIQLLITLAIVFVAPLMIAYAGFLFVTNPVNASGISKAREVLTNTVVGIVIALAGWLIVDAIMAVLYNANASDRSGSVLGTWSNLITSGGITPCIRIAGSLRQADLVPGVPPTDVTGVSATGDLAAPPAGREGTSCDPSRVQAAALTGGYTLSNMQANIFACIAAPESSCASDGTLLLNYNWAGAYSLPASTAAGAFQVLLKRNSGCYENPACYTAVNSAFGTTAYGPTNRLNCASGFDSNGIQLPGSAIVGTCLMAAASLNCSASAAACLLQGRGGIFEDWRADSRSSRQTQCINSGGAIGGG